MVTVPEPVRWKSLARYGLTPFGDPVFRVVYAPSVKKIVGGRAKNGRVGYFVRPAYRHLSGWIIEKWISAFDLTHQTEAQYNATEFDEILKVFPTGPYPHRGVYHFCEELSCHPAQANFDKLTSWIVKAKYNRPQDNMRALMKTMEQKEKAEADERFDRCKELLPAFGIRATSYRNHVKATKSAPIMKSANELGLPVRGPRVQEVRRAV
jgi:hypothetical protein